MKKLVLAAALASGLTGMTVATPAMAEGISVSGNIGLFSEYRFRGVGQSDTNDAAFQGGFDVDFGNGFYVGNWNSNVEFGGASIEMDFYGGYAGEMSGVSYDIGLLKYYYPGSVTDVDATEVYGSLGYAGFTVGANISIDKDYFGVQDAFGDQDGAYYAYLNYDYSVNDALTLSAHYGTSKFEGGADVLDYDDYSIGATYSAMGFDFGLAYVDTDIDGAAKVKDINDDAVVFSVSKSF